MLGYDPGIQVAEALVHRGLLLHVGVASFNEPDSLVHLKEVLLIEHLAGVPFGLNTCVLVDNGEVVCLVRAEVRVNTGWLDQIILWLEVCISLVVDLGHVTGLNCVARQEVAAVFDFESWGATCVRRALSSLTCTMCPESKVVVLPRYELASSGQHDSLVLVWSLVEAQDKVFFS